MKDMIEFTSKQRKALEKIAHDLQPVVIVGGAGVTEGVVDMIDNSLNGQWQIVPVEIAGSNWEVFENEFESYHWVTVELPELTDYIFDEGLVHAYYKFDNNAKTGLPYVKTTVGNDGIPYTETYSCDFVLGNPSTATFHLEASDAGLYDGNPPAASFQIILIW